MQTATQFVPDATSGSVTKIEIAAEPQTVWDALMALTFNELRVTTPLVAARSIPSLLRGKPSLGGAGASKPMLEAMADSRFVILDKTEPTSLALGLVGQFWKLDGGADADISGPEDFIAFDEPGFVKTAMDFVLEPTATGTRITTTTSNTTTSKDAATKFRRYWRVVGWGSKVIRLDMLHALKRRAERVG